MSGQQAQCQTGEDELRTEAAATEDANTDQTHAHQEHGGWFRDVIATFTGRTVANADADVGFAEEVPSITLVRAERESVLTLGVRIERGVRRRHDESWDAGGQEVETGVPTVLQVTTERERSVGTAIVGCGRIEIVGQNKAVVTAPNNRAEREVPLGVIRWGAESGVTAGFSVERAFAVVGEGRVAVPLVSGHVQLDLPELIDRDTRGHRRRIRRDSRTAVRDVRGWGAEGIVFGDDRGGLNRGSDQEGREKCTKSGTKSHL